MKIDKAIELLSGVAYRSVRTRNDHYKDALKMGIEALQRIKAARRDSFGPYIGPLPHETEN